MQPYIGNTYTISGVEKGFSDDTSFENTYWYLSGIEDVGPFGGYVLDLANLNESKLKQNFTCRDCKSKLTRDDLDKAMWKGVPYFICPCCENPITRIDASELDPDEEIEYEIYS